MFGYWQAQVLVAYMTQLEKIEQQAFIDARRQVQALDLTEPQMDRFQEVLRGIDRRFSEVMARRGQ